MGLQTPADVLLNRKDTFSKQLMFSNANPIILDN